MDEPLRETTLADAAGLDLATVRQYLQDFGGYLPASGSGRVKRWSSSCVPTLQIIHRLHADGHTTAEIHPLLAVMTHASPPPVSPPATPPAPPAPAALRRPGLGFDAEIAALRERLYGPPDAPPGQRPGSPPEPPPAAEIAASRPWWAFWRR